MHPPVRRRTTRPGLLLAVAMLALGACTGSTSTAEDADLPGVFDDGVPEPTEEIVLTVAVGDESHDWDLPTLDRLEQQELTILEPFVDEERTFAGPLWADVLRASGVDLDAEPTADLVALDDYVAEITSDPSSLDGLVLATRDGGEEIPVSEGGPIRLVFPPDNPAGENLNNWIWSLRTATIP